MSYIKSSVHCEVETAVLTRLAFALCLNLFLIIVFWSESLVSNQQKRLLKVAQKLTNKICIVSYVNVSFESGLVSSCRRSRRWRLRSRFRIPFVELIRRMGVTGPATNFSFRRQLWFRHVFWLGNVWFRKSKTFFMNLVRPI